MPEARIIPLHADESGGRTRWRLNAAGAHACAAPARAGTRARGHRPGVGGGRSPSCCGSCAGGWTGDYAVDEFGFDADLNDNVSSPSLRPLYEKWFRIEAIGLHNVPDAGGALVVANHSGTLPLDALMTAVALHDHHPAHAAPADARRGPHVQVPRRRRRSPASRAPRWPATRTPSG